MQVDAGEPCRKKDLEIYLEDGVFTHIHICISATRAKSKMGSGYAIEHDRWALHGGYYGQLGGRFRRLTAKR